MEEQSLSDIIINDKQYILGDYLFNNAPIYSKGCRSSRDIISKKQIEAKNYIYARHKDNKWVITDGKSFKFDKIFFIKSFVDKIPEFKNDENNNEISKAPSIITLKDEEKFTDNDGNIIEIETRGERAVDKIYFKVKDVSDGFDMKNLQNDLIKSHTSYENDKDYKYFICEKKDNLLKKTSKQTTTKKELFLTYEGILRVLFVSKCGRANTFIKWATEKLFIIQMGTNEQKIKLRDSLGVLPEVVKEVCKKSTSPISCIYLFSLGTVASLRKTFNINSINNIYNDNDIVIKYGRTEDLERRTTEHNNDYGKLENVELRLMMYSFVDSSYASDAETDIANYINNNNHFSKHKFEGRNELAIISKDKIDMIKKEYEKIRKIYAGSLKELLNEIERLKQENELNNLKHQINIQKLEHSLELQKEKYENEILKRDFEIYKLKK
uniref:Bro-N domain-containing protein n=1 Tax=viral metagenome TaxID=1070528 RepID=A0A6C0HX92_9ZZZZ